MNYVGWVLFYFIWTSTAHVKLQLLWSLQLYCQAQILFCYVRDETYFSMYAATSFFYLQEEIIFDCCIKLTHLDKISWLCVYFSHNLIG